MGAYNKEQLFKILYIKQIQRWYKLKLKELKYQPTGYFDEYFNVNSKSIFVRNMHKFYTQDMLNNYPSFATNKLRYDSWTIEQINSSLKDNKRSTILKWIIHNLTSYQLFYIGF